MAQKNFLQRVAERIQKTKSSEKYRRDMHLARIQAAIFLSSSLPAVFIFWLLKWPPAILLVVLAAIYAVVFGFLPKRIK